MATTTMYRSTIKQCTSTRTQAHGLFTCMLKLRWSGRPTSCCLPISNLGLSRLQPAPLSKGERRWGGAGSRPLRYEEYLSIPYYVDCEINIESVHEHGNTFAYTDYFGLMGTADITAPNTTTPYMYKLRIGFAGSCVDCELHIQSTCKQRKPKHTSQCLGRRVAGFRL